MTRIWYVAVLSTAFIVSNVGAQSISLDYKWLNQPCANNLNCDTGCSACDMPATTSPNFFGTNMIWVGSDAPCPHPITPGDNAIYIGGWPVFVLADHYGKLSALGTSNMRIDSVVIVHRKATNGPDRLKVSYNLNPTAPLVEIADVEITSTFTQTTLVNLGCFTVNEGAAFGAMQLLVQPYQGGTEPWELDEIRIVATPCMNSATGVDEYYQYVQQNKGPYFDVLGRPVGDNAAPGVYSGAKRVVRLP